jgi:hypothetical protein
MCDFKIAVIPLCLHGFYLDRQVFFSSFYYTYYQDQTTSLKMEHENETDDFKTQVFNLSLLNHEQEDKFLNIHLHSVSYEQWVIYGLAMPTFVGKSVSILSCHKKKLSYEQG